MKNHPTKNFVASRKGAHTWKFTFEKGELAIETPHEEDADGGIFFSVPYSDEIDEIEKVLREKVGCDACAEGTYSIRPGRPAKLSWRIISPTH
jgi:hypothetical protein